MQDSREGSQPRVLDPRCNPDNPIVVGWDRVEDATKKLKDGIVRTPCTETRLSEILGMQLYFKKEYMQFTGSFKDRGALYALLNLTENERRKGVVTSSAGNHAQALAYQGSKLGVPVTVVMPLQAPLVKINSCKSLKANVILYGNHFEEAKQHAMSYGRENNLMYINGYDHPDIIAGQGTVGVEILEDIPGLDYILVPVGGGGLIAGICVAIDSLKPMTKVIGVESDKCPSWNTAVSNGRPIRCKVTEEGAQDSIADGLSVVEVGNNAFATAKPIVDKVVTVSEDFIALAILRLLENERAVVEGAGAAGFAAILANILPELKGKKVGCILCGGNIDVTVVGRVIDRGLMMDGRICRFSCIISDRASGLVNLLEVISSSGANVKDILHDRMSLPAYVHKTVVRCTVETKNSEHAEHLRMEIEKEYGSNLHWKNE